jgi:hypothetical protein
MTDPQLTTFAKLFVEQIEHLKERDPDHEDIPVHQRLLAMAQAETAARKLSRDRLSPAHALGEPARHDPAHLAVRDR